MLVAPMKQKKVFQSSIDNELPRAVTLHIIFLEGESLSDPLSRMFPATRPSAASILLQRGNG